MESAKLTLSHLIPNTCCLSFWPLSPPPLANFGIFKCSSCDRVVRLQRALPLEDGSWSVGWQRSFTTSKDFSFRQSAEPRLSWLMVQAPPTGLHANLCTDAAGVSSSVWITTKGVNHVGQCRTRGEEKPPPKKHEWNEHVSGGHREGWRKVVAEQGRWKSESRVGQSSSREAVLVAKGSTRSVWTCLSEPLSPVVRHRTARQG